MIDWRPAESAPRNMMILGVFNISKKEPAYLRLTCYWSNASGRWKEAYSQSHIDADLIEWTDIPLWTSPSFHKISEMKTIYLKPSDLNND